MHLTMEFYSEELNSCKFAFVLGNNISNSLALALWATFLAVPPRVQTPYSNILCKTYVLERIYLQTVLLLQIQVTFEIVLN